MSTRYIASILLSGLLLAACSDTVSQKPSAPHAARAYDPRVPGVQITRIYYDENANQREGGSLNEYIVLQSNDTVVTKRWTLEAGDGVALPLRDTLFGAMTYYTRAESGLPTPTLASFDLGIWIWADHDTARIYNDRRELKSMLVY